MNCNEALLKKLFREDILSSCPKKNTFVKNIFDENPCSTCCFSFFCLGLFSCHEQAKKATRSNQEKLKHAKGFSIQKMEGYKKLTLLGSNKDSNRKN